VCTNQQTTCGTGSSSVCRDVRYDPNACINCGRACGGGQACASIDGCVPACSPATDGNREFLSNTTLAAGTYSFGYFRIAPGVTVTVTGSVPLIIRANSIEIEGTLNASANGSTPGNAGGAGATGASQAGAASPGSGGTPAGGGAGGASGKGGGGGGNATAGGTASSGGAGGSAFGTATMSPFTGGGGGGAGGTGAGCCSWNNFGPGGGGGGAVRLKAAVVRVSGAVLADGANGVSTPSSNTGGGGGGGAGGMVWIEATTLASVTGRVSALGGTGGTVNFTSASAGGNGSAGRVQIIGPTQALTGQITPAAVTGSLAACTNP
jgi:hypothetical protein